VGVVIDNKLFVCLFVYNKQQTSMATSWPIKFHTAAKTGVKKKSNKDAQNEK